MYECKDCGSALTAENTVDFKSGMNDFVIARSVDSNERMENFLICDDCAYAEIDKELA